MTTTSFEHWRQVPEGTWRWKNFSPAEIACRGTGKLLVNDVALDRLQALRDRLGKPLIVRSGYRSPEHNRAIGGAKHSKHMVGAAFDIAMSKHDPATFEAAARDAGFLGFGFYPVGVYAHRTWAEAGMGRALRRGPPSRARPRRRASASRRAGRSRAAASLAWPRLARPASRSRRRCWPRRKTWSCRSCPTSTACAGCSSPRRSPASPSQSTPKSTTGSGARGDRRPRRRPAHPALGTHGAPLGRNRVRRPSIPALPPARRRARRPHGGAPRHHGESGCSSSPDA
jgi:zinc D-Ala-D-Ala carboxypeptidase